MTLNLESNLAVAEELHITNGSGTLTRIVGLKSTNKPSFSVAQVDVTTQDSGGIERTRPGLISLGDISGVIEEPAFGPATLLLSDMAGAKAIRACKIVTGEATIRKEISFSAYVTEFSFGDANEPGTTVQVSFTLKPTTMATVADPA